jgi:type IV secretory pathway TrbD component
MDGNGTGLAPRDVVMVVGLLSLALALAAWLWLVS